ncbi:hypothetical protein MYSTI_00572 [Myxococcus stipitatus DSM 14675]|uniref:Uncharacterized protein n=1 Tax=Myxococcus stipitatus (strain DSM 14675 / JCM 12634 / Mx s8) TaxID=1278073 RepID=L7U2Z6_MYXSD|nr:hypothetical protein [Myxococcus stipitatus]AGC41922.1 hypothetical protein MYSTI_00572 [Myxococcus stipitatus DSM 14675]
MADVGTLDSMGREVSYEELAERLRGHDLLAWLMDNRTLVSTEPQPRLIEGSVEVTHDLETGDGPWLLVILGDLVTTGDLRFGTDDYATSSLLVTGSLRARNVEYGGSARVAVDQDVVVSGVIVGSNGDSEANLGTSGTLTARAVLLDSHTSIWAKAGSPRSVPEGFRTLIVGGKGWREFTPDVDVGDIELHEATFIPEVLHRGMLDTDKALAHARTGASPFLPDVERRLREKRGL